MAAKFEIRSPKAGQFRWVLTSQGRTLATGETYSRRVSAEKAIDSLQAAAATATIHDTTIKARPGKSTAAARDSRRPAGKTAPKKRTTNRAATNTKQPGASRWARKPPGAKPAAKKTTARNTKAAKAPPRQRTARTS